MSAFAGGTYILYDAMENKAFAGYSADGEIEIQLQPYNSVFILCGEISVEGLYPAKQQKLSVMWGDDDVESKVIEPEFYISYAAEKEREYTYYKTTDQLFNITGRKELPHFSGNIKYEGRFEVMDVFPDGNYILDLGQVGEACEMWINGSSVGRRLIPPYAFDITEALKNGDNELTVVVSNHNGYEKRDGFSKYLLFEPSGLLGPITLKKIK